MRNEATFLQPQSLAPRKPASSLCPAQSCAFRVQLWHQRCLSSGGCIFSPSDMLHFCLAQVVMYSTMQLAVQNRRSSLTTVFSLYRTKSPLQSLLLTSYFQKIFNMAQPQTIVAITSYHKNCSHKNLHLLRLSNPQTCSKTTQIPTKDNARSVYYTSLYTVFPCVCRYMLTKFGNLKQKRLSIYICIRREIQNTTT